MVSRHKGVKVKEKNTLLLKTIIIIEQKIQLLGWMFVVVGKKLYRCAIINFFFYYKHYNNNNYNKNLTIIILLLLFIIILLLL